MVIKLFINIIFINTLLLDGLFSPFMMPMHTPLMPFNGNAGFNHPFMGAHSMMQNAPAFASHEFMSPQFPSMMGQPFGQQSSSSFSSSSGGGNNNYSKSVTTSTRNINGVVETVTITKIIDGNVRRRI